MPKYSYRCKECGYAIDISHSMNTTIGKKCVACEKEAFVKVPSQITIKAEVTKGQTKAADIYKEAAEESKETLEQNKEALKKRTWSQQ